MNSEFEGKFETFSKVLKDHLYDCERLIRELPYTQGEVRKAYEMVLDDKVLRMLQWVGGFSREFAIDISKMMERVNHNRSEQVAEVLVPMCRKF